MASQLEEALDPILHTGDFKNVVELKQVRPPSDSEKYFVLTNHFIPPKITNFQLVIVEHKNDTFSINGSHDIMALSILHWIMGVIVNIVYCLAKWHLLV